VNLLPNDQTPTTSRARHLTQIIEMLSRTPAVRAELVADIRSQVTTEEYVSEEKLDLAIYRMLKDILE
jgi:hypothetical protein